MFSEATEVNTESKMMIPNSSICGNHSILSRVVRMPCVGDFAKQSQVSLVHIYYNQRQRKLSKNWKIRNLRVTGECHIDSLPLFVSCKGRFELDGVRDVTKAPDHIS